MEDIRIYDFEFNLLKIENEAKAVNWNIKYNGIGSFEAHFSPESDIVPYIMNNRYLVACQGSKQAVLTGIMFTDDDFAVFGRTPNWLLSKRTIQPFKQDDSGETTLTGIIGYVFGESFVNNELYPVPNMCTLFQIEAEIGEFWRNTRNTAFDVIHDLCVRGENAGHELIFDKKARQWVLRIYAGNEINRIISRADRTASEIILNRDCLDFATDGWYNRQMKDKGEWNASTNNPRINFTVATPEQKYEYYRVSEAGTKNGIAFEVGDYLLCGEDGYFSKVDEIEPIWEHIGESELSGIYRWEAILSEDTPTSAADTLAKKALKDEVTAEIQRLVFGADYNVGDVFKIQLKLGQNVFSYQKRICEVNISYENNIETIAPVFGDEEAEIITEV